jgi:CubicO group peptidase (beta-lactamase class C family)
MKKTDTHLAALAAGLMALSLMGAPAFAQQTAAAAKPAAAEKSAPAKLKKVSVVLTWSGKQQVDAYKDMEKYFAVKTVKKGPNVSPLPDGTAIAPKIKFGGKTQDVDAFMKANRISGLIAVKDGKVVLEKYGMGRKPDDRWTSFSVAKSVTSILYGAALKDHWILSLGEPVTKYLPELKGSGYVDVTLRQLLTMTSGVKWNEDYTDKNSDVARSGDMPWDGKGVDPLITYMSKLPSEAKPGTKLVYKTGETDLAGLALARALAGKGLAQYASEKLWISYGMEQDAIWMTDQAGFERGGCCMSMTLRDYARIGLFMLGGGKAGGKDVFPPGYLEEATTNRLPKDQKANYGYFWWTSADGPYQAIGIFGQGIAIYPADNLVIALNSAMPKASDKKQSQAKAALFAAIRDAANGK